MHIYIPVEPVYSYEETRNFAELLARLVGAERPGLFTTPRSVAKRQTDRVYFDYPAERQVQRPLPRLCAASVPGRARGTPLEWMKWAGLRPAQFTIRNARQRFARTGDLFAGVLKKPQTIEATLERLEKLLPTG